LEKVPNDRAVYVPLGKAYLFYLNLDSSEEIKNKLSKKSQAHQLNFNKAVKIWKKIKNYLLIKPMINTKS